MRPLLNSMQHFVLNVLVDQGSLSDKELYLHIAGVVYTWVHGYISQAVATQSAPCFVAHSLPDDC